MLDEEEYQKQAREFCKQVDHYEISLAMFHERMEELKEKRYGKTGLCCCCGNDAILEPNGLCRPCAGGCSLKLKDKPLITCGLDEELW